MKWLENLPLQIKFSVFVLFIIALFVYNDITINGKLNNTESISKESNNINKVVSKLDNLNLLFSKLEFQIFNDDKTDNTLNNISNTIVQLENDFKQLKKYDWITSNLSTIKKNLSDIIQFTDTKKGSDKKEIITYINNSIHASTELKAKLTNEISLNIEKTNKIIDEGITQGNVFVAIIIFTGLLVLLIFNVIIVSPLKKIITITDKLKEGNLNVKVEDTERRDEIGILQSSVDKLQKSLIEIRDLAENVSEGDLQKVLVPNSDNDILSKSINEMVNKFREINSTLKEEVAGLESTSMEIHSITSQLAASISESTSSISETTATVEEVRKTSEVANDKAVSASNSIAKVLNVASKGKESVADTMEGIEQIKDQIKTIAQHILQLTEQSKAISDIIFSVNEISEQSNLLAVNASIEASRAGEEGKSFVVVAQEMKNLAEQSKKSTAKVRNILNNIQNSINSAVLATENGQKVVTQQIETAKITEMAISKLSETIEEIRNVIDQSTLSTKELFTGMDQITIAMENIKTASEQNAMGSNQLKETINLMKTASVNLNNIIKDFKV